MRILAIRIRNLASLEGTTEIDFTQEPLCSAGIFAITGPTGAGKSTILDALCLALYAKTPRYAQAREMGIELTDVQGNTIHQSDVRAILRDGTADGYAEVDFVGIDGQHYRANWSVRRARNRADGSLQQANTTLRNLTTGNDIGGRKTELLSEIVRLVGLNYDQFIRSVLLAQGDFTAFLKADKDQKASLLEKLTGTHIYSELSKKIFERNREEDQKLKLLQNSQEGIITLTTEELENLQAQATELARDIEQIEAQIDTTAKEIKWHEDRDTYQTQVHEAKQTLSECLAEKTRSTAREAYLKQVEQVQPTRTWMDAIQETTEQFAQRRSVLGDTQMEQQLLVQQVRETEIAVTEAMQELEMGEAAYEEAQPLLDQAKRLDTQLQAKETEVAAAERQLATRKAKWEASRQRLRRQQEEAEALSRQIDEWQQWKERRFNRRAVAENHAFIVSKLTDARKQLEAIEKASSNIAQLESDISVKAAEHVQLAQRSKHLAEEVEEVNAQMATLQQELSATAIDQLRKESKAMSEMVEDLRNATVVWRQVYQSLQAENALTEKVAATHAELTATEVQLHAASAALQTVSEQRKTSAILLERATFAASENVALLRGELVDGQPCPVCGSETHPYAHENPQLNHVLDELKKAHETLETKYNEQLANHSQLVQSVTLLQQTLTALDSDRQTGRSSLQAHTAVWEACAVSQACAHLASEEKESWLAEQLVQAKAKQETIAQQVEYHESLQSRYEAVRQTWQIRQTEYTDTANATKDLARILQTLKERLAITQSEWATHTDSLEDTLTALQPNFPDDQWIANWKNQPDSFLESITAFAEEWKQTTDAIEQNRQRQGVSQATLAGIQAEEQTLAADVAESEHDLADIEAARQALRESRQSIFDGEVVQTVEARLKQHVIHVRERLNTAKQQRERHETERVRTDAAIKETEKEIARLEKRIGELSGKITQWLAEYAAKQQHALDTAALQALLSHSPEWIVEEREALMALERAITQALSVLEERKRQLTQHEKKRPSEQPIDALEQQLAQLHLRKSESLREHNEIGFQLKQDEANKQRLGDLLTDIQAQAAVVENWAKLNDVIGSADGKKFRQAAQEYTLDVLLGYANVHLEIVSRRYRLQRIPNTLGLQVLDQDMGDEVRTVYSLSGGESFLVSLALALGLASLSANRMRVESLFIDEGFGSLDPNTLNIAMDALERLHNQGRKVGVISHVQEMTERIPVQINVHKQRSGKSSVHVNCSP